MPFLFLGRRQIGERTKCCCSQTFLPWEPPISWLLRRGRGGGPRSPRSRSHTRLPLVSAAVLTRGGHPFEVVRDAATTVASVDARDVEHPGSVAAGVARWSPSGRHGTLVLVCLSPMPVRLSDGSLETGLEGDSFLDAGRGWMFTGSGADRWAQLLRQRQLDSQS